MSRQTSRADSTPAAWCRRGRARPAAGRSRRQPPPMTSISALAVELRQVAEERHQRDRARPRPCVDGRAPRPRDERRTAARAPSAGVRPSGVKIHGRPLNRSGRAKPKPPRSAPPIGWPPTNDADSGSARGRVDDVALRAADVGDDRRRPAGAARSRASSSRFWRTGAARMIEVGLADVGDVVGSRDRWRRCPARGRAPPADRRRRSRTAGQRSRTASAIDPPIRPRPMMAIGLKGGVGGGHRQLPTPNVPTPKGTLERWELGVGS